MTFVKCPEPECGKMVSDQASICPACGFPSPGAPLDPTIAADDSTVYAPVYSPHSGREGSDNFLSWRIRWLVKNEAHVRKNQPIATAEMLSVHGTCSPHLFPINAVESGILYQMDNELEGFDSHGEIIATIQSTRKSIYNEVGVPWNLEWPDHFLPMIQSQKDFRAFRVRVLKILGSSLLVGLLIALVLPYLGIAIVVVSIAIAVLIINNKLKTVNAEDWPKIRGHLYFYFFDDYFASRIEKEKSKLMGEHARMKRVYYQDQEAKISSGFSHSLRYGHAKPEVNPFHVQAK